MACSHCYASRFQGLKELSTDEAVEMIKGLAEINAEHLSITGGEPTLRGDLPKLIVEAQERDLEVSVVTNTLLLKEELMNLLARRDVEVQFSVDGVRKETFTRIRGPFLDIVLERIRKLKELGVKLRPIMTINAVNHEEAGDYVRMCAEMGAIGCAIIPIIPVGRARGSLVPTPNMVEGAVQAAAQAAEELGFNVELWCAPFAVSIVDSRSVSVLPCTVGSGLDIAPDGDILLCDTLDVKVASVKMGMPNAWQAYLGHELVRVVSTQSGLKAACRRCKYAGTCLGGCHARAKIMCGDLKMPDPLCPLSRNSANV